MNRHEEIKNAYKNLGGDATFYDGMITCSTLSGKADKAVCLRKDLL